MLAFSQKYNFQQPKKVKGKMKLKTTEGTYTLNMDQTRSLRTDPVQ